MATKTPEIRLYYSYLLRENISEHFAKLYKTELLSQEKYEEFTENYKNAWQPVEKKILTSMCEVLNLKFYKSIVDVPLAPYLIGQSSPMILNFLKYPDEFIDLLAHELAHVLLTDNDKYSFHYNKDINLVKKWAKMYGQKRSWKELVHIPIHAILKFIYLDILQESRRLERDIEQCQKWPGYKEAWIYIESNDYKKILTDLEHMYEELPAVNS